MIEEKFRLVKIDDVKRWERDEEYGEVDVKE